MNSDSPPPALAILVHGLWQWGPALYVMRRRLQADGSIRDGNPAVQARTIYLLLQPYVIAMRPSTSDLELDDLVTEVGRMLDVSLRP